MTPAFALAAAGLLALVVAFQLGLAAGAPWGRAAWGGRQPAVLPARLRLASGVSALSLAAFALVVLAQGGVLSVVTPSYLRWATWGIAGLLALSGLGNLLSPSRAERLALGPLALLTSLFCALVATAPHP